MPQHLWRTVPLARSCEARSAIQVNIEGKWALPVHHICPGD
jgi:hypothetical protein